MRTKDILIFANCGNGIDDPIGNAEDLLQVEISDDDNGGVLYLNIKEFFCLSNPNRIIIRLENN